MGGDCEIASLHHHVADLAFSKIFEGPIVTRTVGIAMRKTFLASDDDDKRMLRWRNYPALLLSTIFSVNVAAAVIDASFLKAPAHFSPQQSAKGVRLTRLRGGRKDRRAVARHATAAIDR